MTVLMIIFVALIVIGFGLYSLQDFYPGGKEYDSATKRWTANNARAIERGCMCGKPTEIITSSHHGHIGAVAPMFVSCKEHAKVPHTWPWRSANGGPMLPVSGWDGPDGPIEL